MLSSAVPPVLSPVTASATPFDAMPRLPSTASVPPVTLTVALPGVPPVPFDCTIMLPIAPTSWFGPTFSVALASPMKVAFPWTTMRPFCGGGGAVTGPPVGRLKRGAPTKAPLARAVTLLWKIVSLTEMFAAVVFTGAAASAPPWIL